MPQGRTSHIIQLPGGPTVPLPVTPAAGACDCALLVNFHSISVPDSTLTTIPFLNTIGGCGAITGRNTIGYAFFVFTAIAGGYRECLVYDGSTVVASQTISGFANTALHGGDHASVPFFNGLYSLGGLNVRAIQTSGGPLLASVYVYQWEQCNCNCAFAVC